MLSHQHALRPCCKTIRAGTGKRLNAWAHSHSAIYGPFAKLRSGEDSVNKMAPMSSDRLCRCQMVCDIRTSNVSRLDITRSVLRISTSSALAIKSKRDKIHVPCPCTTCQSIGLAKQTKTSQEDIHGNHQCMLPQYRRAQEVTVYNSKLRA